MNANHRTSPNGTAPAPELSVVVSCFNRADVIETALRRCFAAVGGVVAHSEVIVINDGSKDGSVRILDRLRKEFPQLRVIHQLHSGDARALRRGYDLARGEYIFQFDVDCQDWLADFSRFWDHRGRYALILGKSPEQPGPIQRLFNWAFSRWIKLWFGAELTAPTSVYRLCETLAVRPYVQAIPREFEEPGLGVALTFFRDHPRRILELEMPQPLRPARFAPSLRIARFLHYLQEVPALRVKRLPAPKIAHVPQSI